MLYLQELSTAKAENSILKAKVRRVDDENVQKGRQIEKLRVEIKALQKVLIYSFQIKLLFYTIFFQTLYQ